MRKFCFVSYEIHPTLKGGCGVFLNNAAHILLPQENELIFLLDISNKDFKQFNEIDRLNLPNPQNCRAYQVQALAKKLTYKLRDFKSVFEYRAMRFYTALQEIEALEKPDIIEFFEYCGIGYNVLNAKVTGLGFRETHLTVRLHGTLELIDQQQPGSIHGIDRYLMYGLEHHTLRLAETVLCPSKTFYENAYKPNYEAWHGDIIYSKPPLMERLEKAAAPQDPNIILFYGRLHGIKGVDIFVHAAILYLSNPNNPHREFYLAGYDSHLPPGSKSSYQAYLRLKIPAQFQENFHFTGQLSRQEMGKLLPEVLFAIVPSYFESFCYAAHELYEAGIPLIVSDIPAFEDYFHAEENALVFDGTVSDLAQQMTRLSSDENLRQRISRPYPVIQNPLGDFYLTPPSASWIKAQEFPEPPSLLIIILCDHPEKLDTTLRSLKALITRRMRIVTLHPIQEDGTEQVTAWFLGKLYSFQDERGESLTPTQILNEEALLILKAGDTLEPSFVTTGLATLQRQPQISFVGSWKNIIKGRKTQVETLSLDASLELAPFLRSSIFNRFVMRTKPGKLLLDLFDPRAGSLGELDHLWKLDNGTNCGVMIPEALVTCPNEDDEILKTNAIDYLIIRDDNTWRKKRLSRFLLSLGKRSKRLRSHYHAEEVFRLADAILNMAWKMIDWTVNTPVGHWIMQNPRMKQFLRKAAGVLLPIEPE